MDARQAEPSRTVGRRTAVALRRLLLLAGVCAALGGCASFWDDITSRDFHFKDMFKPSLPPLAILRTSNDGDKKSKALRSLREPLQHGGTKEEQEEVMRVLTWSAVSEPQPLCRMAAIDTLQNFKDPRAAQVLLDAYLQAGYFQRDHPETVSVLRCQALSAMGVNGNPIVVERLVGIAEQPPSASADANKTQEAVMDERIAAVRALAHFNQYRAAEALVKVLRTERGNVALRNRATESLCELTGEDLPPDAQAWDDFLHKPGSRDALAQKHTFSQKFFKLASFLSDQPKEPAAAATTKTAP